ncbi:MAG: Alpha/beta hydrolase family protein [Promethearchaeota archaeon]|nr:MAG: Alpha/beta hydrolase family protein [Candidatus Lokiarchaeota archaeon]
MENYNTTNVEIPANEIKLMGTIYYKSKLSGKRPWIINLPGLMEHRESYFVKFFTERFVASNYNVLSYDYRAHGETADQTGKNWLKMIPQIFSDIIKVIDWVFDKHTEKIDNISLFGRSLGGAIILTHGYNDTRPKKLIALCTRYDYHSFKLDFPEEVIQKMSPRYFLKNSPTNNTKILLAHCKDDPQIPYENVNQIQASLSLVEENVIRYEEGGHSFKGHREELFKKCLHFLEN